MQRDSPEDESSPTGSFNPGALKRERKRSLGRRGRHAKLHLHKTDLISGMKWDRLYFSAAAGLLCINEERYLFKEIGFLPCRQRADFTSFQVGNHKGHFLAFTLVKLLVVVNSFSTVLVSLNAPAESLQQK